MAVDRIPFTLRLPEGLLKDLRLIANEENRSVNNLIENFLTKQVNKYYADQEY